MELVPRYWVCSSNGRCQWRNNRWFDFGRWILLGVLAFLFIVGLFAFACLARRRRRRGAKPMYGTGWMVPAGKYNGGQVAQEMNSYQPGYNQGYAPPPPPPVPPEYGQPQQQQYTGTTGTTFSPNNGYYGGVQQPPSAYQREGAPYSPPPGK